MDTSSDGEIVHDASAFKIPNQSPKRNSRKYSSSNDTASMKSTGKTHHQSVGGGASSTPEMYGKSEDSDASDSDTAREVVESFLKNEREHPFYAQPYEIVNKAHRHSKPRSKTKKSRNGNTDEEIVSTKSTEMTSVFEVSENDVGHITTSRDDMQKQMKSKPICETKEAKMLNEVRYLDHFEEQNNTEIVNDDDGIALSISKIRLKPGYSDNGDSDTTEEEVENVLQNERALSAYAPTYELEKFEKKALIIFNHVNIIGDVDKPYEPRKGTDKDVNSLTQTFGRFGFDVVVHPDLTRKQIFKEIDGFCKNYSNYGCVAVAVLTHGGDNGVLRAKDKKYYEREILSRFKSYQKLSLLTKPLILIIQACRGSDSIKGVKVKPCNESESVHHDADTDEAPYYLPLEADTLVLHSSYYGKPSHRNEKSGSWFIQTLCKEINKHADTYDLERIMVMVKMRVAINCKHKVTRPDETEDINKQMPVVTSTLFRLLFLRKFGDPSPNVELPPSFPKMTGTDELDNPISKVQVQNYFSGNDRNRNPHCPCLKSHYDYFRKCLSHFVKECPRDATAQALLNLAQCKHNSDEELTKNTLITISDYLENQCRHFQYHRFLYFFKGDLRNSVQTDSVKTDCDHREKNNKSLFWEKIKNNTKIVGGIFACVSTAVIYEVMKRKLVVHK